MRGTNPKRPPIHDDGRMLDVVRIFPTLQGEGPRAGQPAIFIRLGGCNLACDFCDTEFENFSKMAVEAIEHSCAGLIDDSQQGIKLIVITGGEPLRQPIGLLCERLIAADYIVQIETNGTLMRALPDAVEMICSPKNTGQGYAPLRPDLLKRVSALKFIISATHPLYQTVADVGQTAIATEIYVQPMDEYDADKNQVNLDYTTDLAERHGYHLSLQLHKILALD